jgi:hypothetical protein
MQIDEKERGESVPYNIIHKEENKKFLRGI